MGANISEALVKTIAKEFIKIHKRKSKLKLRTKLSTIAFIKKLLRVCNEHLYSGHSCG